LFYFLLIIAFSFTYSIHIYGQEKFNISGGFGILDGLNIGARYQVKQDTLQLGISIGTYDVEKTISGDVFYHFGGYSKLSTRRPLYLKCGFTNVFEFDTEESYWVFLFNLRLGRDINLSKKAGLNLEAGICYSPFALIMMDEYRIIPSFGLYFFYRI